MSDNDIDRADEPTKSVEKNDHNTDQADGPAEGAGENNSNTDQAEEPTGVAEASEETVEGENDLNNQAENPDEVEERAEDLGKGLGLEEKASENSSDELALNSETSADSEVALHEETSMANDGVSEGETNTDDHVNLPKENMTNLDVDIVAASQGVATVELELINSNLKGIEQEISRLAHPTDQHLDKAKRLILMLSGVTGMVLVASITFFIVMSVSIAQKVDDLDRVLMAVAKRGIQLADGIEIIAEMEAKLSEIVDQNGQIIPELSSIETQITSVGKDLTDTEEQTRSVLKDYSASILESQGEIKNSLNLEVTGLEELIRKSVKLKPLGREHSALKNQLEKINSSMINVETKVQDLYVIKQAEIETAYKGLSHSE